MGMFCLNLMRIALELAKENPVYEAMAAKFFEHYAYVADAMKHMGNRDYQLWDEEDGFFYDVLRYPDGRFRKFRVRSLVGLIPLFAVERLEEDWIEPFKEFSGGSELVSPRTGRNWCRDVVHEVEQGRQENLRPHHPRRQTADADHAAHLRPRRVLIADYGIRSLSKAHLEHPF